MKFQITLTPQQVAQVMDYMHRKVEETCAHLRTADIEGANQVMDEVQRDAGQGCHDLVLDAIARRFGQPSWRVAADTPEWRNYG
ncbi:hypothetical protein FHX81_2331 [Saccharothrix saharensis]|uniref:Uncharacterized protein n=1 Tax=Saccharothrix saharensis TaxID=571190 RepID=A0A543JB09_9PSEU|nr:hypothetical protein [Saccharothrix saharensis]TQM80009.1 hypothetical protein FHX81_2331 [Saccharothrix saharensis]